MKAKRTVSKNTAATHGRWELYRAYINAVLRKEGH